MKKKSIVLREKHDYTETSLREAISKVRGKELTAYKASKLFKIPRQTIENHIKDKVKSFSRGRPTTFSEEEEKALVDYYVELAKSGFGLDIESLQSFVQNYAKKLEKQTPFKNGMPGVDWIHGFEIC